MMNKNSLAAPFMLASALFLTGCKTLAQENEEAPSASDVNTISLLHCFAARTQEQLLEQADDILKVTLQKVLT